MDSSQGANNKHKAVMTKSVLKLYFVGKKLWAGGGHCTYCDVTGDSVERAVVVRNSVHFCRVVSKDVRGHRRSQAHLC